MSECNKILAAYFETLFWKTQTQSEHINKSNLLGKTLKFKALRFKISLKANLTLIQQLATDNIKYICIYRPMLST